MDDITNTHIFLQSLDTEQVEKREQMRVRVVYFRFEKEGFYCSGQYLKQTYYNNIAL